MKAEIELSKLGSEKIKIIIENSKEKNHIFGTEFQSLIYYDWWFVKTEIPRMLKEFRITPLVNSLLAREQAIEVAEDADTKDIVAVVVWVIAEIKRINELELEYLTSPPNIDLQNAGVQELEQFGEQNTLDVLTGGDLTKEDEIKKIPYHRVFDRLRKNLISAEIDARYKEIMESKRKPKKPGH